MVAASKHVERGAKREGENEVKNGPWLCQKDSPKVKKEMGRTANYIAKSLLSGRTGKEWGHVYVFLSHITVAIAYRHYYVSHIRDVVDSRVPSPCLVSPHFDSARGSTGTALDHMAAIGFGSPWVMRCKLEHLHLADPAAEIFSSFLQVAGAATRAFVLILRGIFSQSDYPLRPTHPRQLTRPVVLAACSLLRTQRIE